MIRKAPESPRAEFEFALVVAGVGELEESVENALFAAGCDDATLSMQHGLLYAEFNREAASLKDAVISAIRDINAARIGAEVLRIDDSNLVTASDIARRTDRSRQLIHQYITGQRGPGDFPPPEYHLTGRKPLWAWSVVSRWLASNDLLRPDDNWHAEIIAAINNALERARQQRRHRDLIEQIETDLAAAGV